MALGGLVQTLPDFFVILRFSGFRALWTLYMSKVGPIWHFSVLCLLAPGDTIPNSKFFSVTWGHPKTLKNASFHAL